MIKLCCISDDGFINSKPCKSCKLLSERGELNFEMVLRIVILERDKYSCTECGCEENLNIHHIKPVSKYPRLKYSESNCKTLCVTCHKNIHSKMNNDNSPFLNGMNVCKVKEIVTSIVENENKSRLENIKKQASWQKISLANSKKYSLKTIREKNRKTHMDAILLSIKNDDMDV